MVGLLIHTKREPKGFAEGFGPALERKRELTGSYKILGSWANGMMEFPLTKMGQSTGRVSSGENIRFSMLDMLSFKYPWHRQRVMMSRQ